jgi:hypothetical protein
MIVLKSKVDFQNEEIVVLQSKVDTLERIVGNQEEEIVVLKVI